MLSNIVVELPWNTLMAVLIFLCFYYPIGLYRNAEPTNAVNERAGLMFLFILTFLLFTSTFAHMVIAGIEDAETGGNLANLMFSICLIFCGYVQQLVPLVHIISVTNYRTPTHSSVLAGPSSLRHFWIFLYYISPFTYLISGMLSTSLANTNVVCSSIEYLHFAAPNGTTCGSYMQPYIQSFGGYLLDPAATTDCSFCAIDSTNVFLSSVSSSYEQRWRNFGIMWVYIGFNVIAAITIYWLARVPKKAKKE